MPSLPDGWKLKQKKRKDGRVDIVGKTDLGDEYVARTTEGPGVTDRDLKILSVGNRETSTAADVVKFYQGERDSYNAVQADSMMDGYMDGAERVVRAGLHLSESRAGSTRAYREAWERLERKGYI